MIQVLISKEISIGTATVVCEDVRRRKKRLGITAGEAHEAVAVSEDREERVSVNVPLGKEHEDSPRAMLRMCSIKSSLSSESGWSKLRLWRWSSGNCERSR